MRKDKRIPALPVFDLCEPEYQTYSCESCGNDAHYGYPCPSFVPDPCYNRNFDCFPHDSQTLPQQYQTPPVASMEMLHAQTDLIEAMQDFLKKYDHIPHNEKSIKLLLAEEKFLKIKQVVEEEQTQPEYFLKEFKDQEEKSIAELLAEERLQKANQALNESQSPQEMRIQDLEIQKQQCLEEMKEWMNDLGIREIRKRFRGEEINEEYERDCENRIDKLKIDFNEWGSEIRKKEQAYNEERNAAARRRMLSITFDDDDDSIPLGDIIARSKAITPDLPIEEPDNFLSMGDEHLDTIPSVEYLVPIPRESEGLSDNESECDMPVCDVSSPIFTVFSNPLFDSNDNFSSDDESLSEEEIQKDEFNSFSNPLYDIDDEIITNESNLLSKKDLDEIILIPPGIDEPCFNAESDLLESLLNRDSPIDSTKTDSIFDEFSFPRLPEEHNSENVDTIIESLSYSPIPVEDSDSLIMCFLNKTKNSQDNYESKEDRLTLEKDVFQNEDISNQEEINDTCETERDLKFFDDLLNENTLPPDVSNVENDFQDNKEEIDISCDMIPPGIDTDDDSEGDVPPFEEPLDMCFLSPSRVERKFLSMVDELFNLSNDDETFDPGGGENDVLLNKGENNDLNVCSILEASWFKNVEGQSNSPQFH
ncbi:hypothetical protein Tco_0473073 [Tanacetum coccineum]